LTGFTELEETDDKETGAVEEQEKKTSTSAEFN
jgi:hypothetical protein